MSARNYNQFSICTIYGIATGYQSAGSPTIGECTRKLNPVDLLPAGHQLNGQPTGRRRANYTPLTGTQDSLTMNVLAKSMKQN